MVKCSANCGVKLHIHFQTVELLNLGMDRYFHPICPDRYSYQGVSVLVKASGISSVNCYSIVKMSKLIATTSRSFDPYFGIFLNTVLIYYLFRKWIIAYNFFIIFIWCIWMGNVILLWICIHTFGLKEINDSLKPGHANQCQLTASALFQILYVVAARSVPILEQILIPAFLGTVTDNIRSNKHIFSLKTRISKRVL